jgi:hypothetical protein
MLDALFARDTIVSIISYVPKINGQLVSI